MAKKIKMKIKSYLKGVLYFVGLSVAMTSCFNDLDTVPTDPDEITSAVVYDDPAAYKQVLAKVYAGLSVSGQQGPSGQADIAGIDEGFGQYTRGFWYHQELSTDEAVIGWNDATIKDFHEQDWSANDGFIGAFYSRVFYQIALCNEFLRETTDQKLSDRGVDEALRAEIQIFRAEARFLRALSYWHALDCFRNVPFVTEEDNVGAFFPEQVSGAELYTFIETELKEIETQLVAAGQNEYARADQAAAWMLLAKLYLNAEVYAGKAAYTECITYCQKILDAGYTLDPEYQNLFLADNHTAEGIIFPVVYDGVNTRTWGGTTFIIHAAVGGSMNINDFGIDGGWGGTRTTSALVDKFPAVGGGSLIVAPNDGNEDYPVLQVPGSYQGWDPEDVSTVLASVAADSTYEGYLYFPEDGTALKFTDGPSWDVDFGDSDGDGILEPGGSDITIADAGFYRLTVNLISLEYSIEKTDWGLIGSATAGGWDVDEDMTYDVDEGALVITTDLMMGDIKFRANDDWALNYGDTGADALLEQEGDNIAIPGPGTYTIKLYLDKPDYTYSIERPSFDKRAMFYTDGQSKEIVDISQFTEGYAITKFKNITRDGQAGSDLTHTDTDFPMFRLADAHLMLAEAVLRGGSGSDLSTAVDLVNAVRERAYGDQSGNISEAELTLDFILDERARELYWECHRRTDLVRFGQFSNGDYLWPWKGGVAGGATVSNNFDLYPLPASDVNANPNLVQNPGY